MEDYQVREVAGFRKFFIGVAIVVCAALILQTGGLIWWASAINKQVNQNKDDIKDLTAAIAGVKDTCDARREDFLKTLGTAAKLPH